jgi:hypothetical protein
VERETYNSLQLRTAKVYEALEVDLVDHNGGSSVEYFAYTVSVVDVLTGYSCNSNT